jgi:hypothetical protein
VHPLRVGKRLQHFNTVSRRIPPGVEASNTLCDIEVPSGPLIYHIRVKFRFCHGPGVANLLPTSIAGKPRTTQVSVCGGLHVHVTLINRLSLFYMARLDDSEAYRQALVQKMGKKLLLPYDTRLERKVH